MIQLLFDMGLCPVHWSIPDINNGIICLWIKSPPAPRSHSLFCSSDLCMYFSGSESCCLPVCPPEIWWYDWSINKPLMATLNEGFMPLVWGDGLCRERKGLFGKICFFLLFFLYTIEQMQGNVTHLKQETHSSDNADRCKMLCLFKNSPNYRANMTVNKKNTPSGLTSTACRECKAFGNFFIQYNSFWISACVIGDVEG